MQLEFQDYYDGIFSEQTTLLEKLLLLKLGTISLCNVKDDKDDECNHLNNKNFPSYTTDLLEKTPLFKLREELNLEDGSLDRDEKSSSSSCDEFGKTPIIHEEFGDLQIRSGPFSDGEGSHKRLTP
jgi:hypothetical protein